MIFISQNLLDWDQLNPNLLFFSEDPEGELWHSTAIVSRLNSRCVQTKSGSHYKLVGPVNEKVTLQQGNNNKIFALDS